MANPTKTKTVGARSKAECWRLAERILYDLVNADLSPGTKIKPLREIVQEYRRLTGRPAVLLSGSTSGAAAWGTRVL